MVVEVPAEEGLITGLPLPEFRMDLNWSGGIEISFTYYISPLKIYLLFFI